MEKCPHCDALIKENKQLRRDRTEEHRNYVEVINENLELRRLVADYDNRLSAITLNRILRSDLSQEMTDWENEGGK